MHNIRCALCVSATITGVFRSAFLSWCYRLKVCMPLKFIFWNLIPNVMVSGSGFLGWWLGHESRALMNGISALIKETPESSLAMLGHSNKTAVYEQGGRFSQGTESINILILDFPASKTVRNKCLLFKPPSPWYFCYSSPNWLKREWGPQRRDSNHPVIHIQHKRVRNLVVLSSWHVGAICYYSIIYLSLLM